MIVRWKVIKLVDGKEQIVQNEVKVSKVNVHYNWIYIWRVDTGVMVSLNLRSISDVRIVNDVDSYI